MLIYKPNASLEGSAVTNQSSGDLYFKLVPVKNEKQQEEIKIRASKEAVIKTEKLLQNLIIQTIIKSINKSIIRRIK